MDSDGIKGIAQTYFDAWRSRDFDRLRSILADDVSFRGPLGSADGADACIAGLRGMAENVLVDLDISLMAVDGSDVLTWFDLHTVTTEPLATVNWSHVEDGLISRIRVVFDPRPLSPPEAGRDDPRWLHDDVSDPGPPGAQRPGLVSARRGMGMDHRGRLKRSVGR